MKSFQFRLLLITIFIVLLSNTIIKSEPVDTLLFENYIDSELYLRKIINQSPIFYLDESSFYYYEDERLFLYGDYQKVKIVSIKKDSETNLRILQRNRYNKQSDENLNELIEIKYSNKMLGTRSVYLKSNCTDGYTIDLFNNFIDNLFLKDTLEDKFNYYAKNEKSGLIHSSLCNHLNKNYNFSLLKTIEPQDELNLCPACFISKPIIEDFSIDEFMGRTVANHYLSTNILVNDDSLQKYLDSLGHIVLDSWPYTLRGYDYTFLIVENLSINALSCPGGIVIVNMGLLNTVENEEELKWVLAHEISHVEFRHGFRQYRSAQKSAFWSSFAAAFAGTVIASTTDNTNSKIAIYEITSSVINLFSEIILNGYSQKYEIESDMIAEYYLNANKHKNYKYSIKNFLRKMQYASREIPGNSPWRRSDNSTHPKISERIQLCNSPMVIFDSPIQYFAFDEDNNKVATFIIKGFKGYQALSPVSNNRSLSKEANNSDSLVMTYIYFCEISATRFMIKPAKVKNVSIKNVSGRFDKLDNKENTKLYPNSTVSLVLYNYPIEEIKINEVSEIRLKLPNVKKWERGKI